MGKPGRAAALRNLAFQLVQDFALDPGPAPPLLLSPNREQITTILYSYCYKEYIEELDELRDGTPVALLSAFDASLFLALLTRGRAIRVTGLGTNSDQMHLRRQLCAALRCNRISTRRYDKPGQPARFSLCLKRGFGFQKEIGFFVGRQDALWHGAAVVLRHAVLPLQEVSDALRFDANLDAAQAGE